MENSTGFSQNTFTYDSPHPVYAMAFSPAPSLSPRLALGSFIENSNNQINIIDFDPESAKFHKNPSFSFNHTYPPTKLMFSPNPTQSILASSGEFLRLWNVNNHNSTVEIKSVLDNSQSSNLSAPLTSFDWNDFDTTKIGTSSIDTTCTIWDVEKEVLETQLIAHDKEVYDIAWGGAGSFASVSADGSVRMFDLRDKEHSTIVYESPRPDTPLLRVAWNKTDPRYIGAITMDSNKVVVLDIRVPPLPVAELVRHRGSVNAIAWAPRSGRHLCSGGDDGQALIWEVDNGSGVVGGDGVDPILAYSAGWEINQLQWSVGQPSWIGIAFANKVQLLRV